MLPNALAVCELMRSLGIVPMLGLPHPPRLLLLLVLLLVRSRHLRVRRVELGEPLLEGNEIGDGRTISCLARRAEAPLRPQLRERASPILPPRIARACPLRVSGGLLH